jgi:Peptidase A4 family
MAVRRGSIGFLAVLLTLGPVVLMFPASAGVDASAGGYAGRATGIRQSPTVADASQQFTSRNWDGYITYASSHGTDFNTVKATWVQPSVTCAAAGAWTVFWVGLDGWWDNTVEQGGSEARCGAAGGPATYSLWWEMFPTNAIQTVLAINSGDTISASVSYVTTTSMFTITVKDLTSGTSFSKHEACATNLVCSRSSADVITEDVGKFGSNAYFPLADYGTMGYTNAGATDTAGHKGSISGKNWLNAAVSEISGGVTYATVTRLSAHGTAFSAIWQHQ